MDKVIVFDIWGDLGHFKKPYTTTSPLSFAFPPRTTIAGMISAIIGLDKNEYADRFTKLISNIGIRIINPVKKIGISQNLIDTKKAKLFSKIRQRTQIRIEYIKDPKYRIYFQHQDTTLFERFNTLLKNHESVYTVSLGLSELLANFQYVGQFDLEAIANKAPVEIQTVALEQKVEIEEFEEGKEYFSAHIPLEMNRERIVSQFGTVLYERNGNPILVKTRNAFRVENGEQILFI